MKPLLKWCLAVFLVYGLCVIVYQAGYKIGYIYKTKQVVKDLKEIVNNTALHDDLKAIGYKAREITINGRKKIEWER